MHVLRGIGRWLALGSVLALALGLRFAGLGWDGWLGAHPDERHIEIVASSLRGLNPYDTGDPANPRLFAYGHVVVYLLVAVEAVFNRAGQAPYGFMLVAGRCLSALADTATVGLVYGLGRRLAGRAAGLWAAAACAVSVLHVQLAHFYTPDPLLAMFVAAGLLCMVWRAQGGPRAAAWLSAVFAGLAVGTKVTAVLILVPLVVAVRQDLLRAGVPDSAAADAGRAGALVHPLRSLRGLARRFSVRPLVFLLLATLLVFAVTNPFAVFWSRVFAESTLAQFAMASGQADYPYTRQFAGTLPYVYPFEQLGRWGLDPPLAALAVAGLAYGVWRAARREAAAGEWVLLAWAVPYLLVTGASYAKFARYLLPVTPALCVFAAILLARIWRRAPALAGLLGALALVAAGGHALALDAMYVEPHPWQSASAWIYRNVPPGAGLAVELWDDALPWDLQVDGRPRSGAEYSPVVLDPYAPDSPEKLVALAAGLARSDYVALSSQRLYGTIPRLAALGDPRYQATACYYRRLFAGALGFRLVYAGARFPRLGPLVLVDRAFAAAGLPEPEGLPAVDGWAIDLGRVDESYNVYDHPQVLIFENVERWGEERLRAAIGTEDCRGD